MTMPCGSGRPPTLPNMRPSSVHYWRQLGLLGPAPWTFSTLLAEVHWSRALKPSQQLKSSWDGESPHSLKGKIRQMKGAGHDLWRIPFIVIYHASNVVRCALFLKNSPLFLKVFIIQLP